MGKKINFDIEVVRDMYLTQNLMKKEIAAFYKCSVPSIDRLLKKHGIKKPMDKQVECRKRGSVAKYGVDNPSKAQVVKDKKVETCRKHFGVNYSLQSPMVREKGKETIRKIYGVEYISQSPIIQERIEQTNLKKHGVKRYINSEKAQQTRLERYGVRFSSQSPVVQEKRRETCREVYGCDYASQNEDVKQRTKNTNIKKYGTTCTLANEEVKQKAKDTMFERYGKRSYTQTEEYKEKSTKTNFEKYGEVHYSKTKEFLERVKQTNLENFGVEFASQCPKVKQKIDDTKRKNGTFNFSKPELIIEESLKDKFGEVCCQYKSEKYPFDCDFYVPSLNLYIEYQGWWGHKGRPFDPSDEQCLNELESWKQKVAVSAQYENAIHVWTVSDPLKRETAKKNGLNWIEFFNLNEFQDWLSKQEGKKVLYE